jgi:signal transduction histidine kinase
LRERLAKAEQQVRESEHLASMGRVAAGIAHEIGNPLTGIANFTHILRSRIGSTPDADAALNGIEREVDRIDRIVNSMLDYARPQHAAPTPFDGASALRAAVDLLSTQGVFRTVHLESSIDERPLALVGDSHELEQAFVNILLNAIDAMESRGTLALYAGQLTPETIVRATRRSMDPETQQFARPVNPRVDAWRERVAADQPCAKFVIADSGTGIDGEHADRVFDPFFTTKESEGSGLGLAIVQRVVEAHNGVVWVQRAREGGAAFHVVLPLGSPEGVPQDVS